MDEAPRKRAQRTCISCLTTDAKQGFVRFVRRPDGTVELDPTGRASGRGAYVCAKRECFEQALKHRKLSSALKAGISEDDLERLRRDFELEVARANAQ